MVRYFYAWTPLALIGTVVLLSLPWLGLFALMIASLAALGALAFAGVYVPYMLIQAIRHRWHGRPRTAAVLAPPTRQHTFEKGYVS